MPKFSRTLQPQYEKPSGRVSSYGGAYQAIVKDNRDVQRMGRLRVWIPEMGSRPDDEGGWITVSYCSPFAGATNPDNLENNPRIDNNSQTSYGLWLVPPDIGNIVIVMFINKDPTRGIWIGSLYQQFMNNMVPGIPAEENFQHDRLLPTTEYNKRGRDRPRDDMLRPELREVSESIANQGLINDTLRGAGNSSARRESPSEVYGLLTPGPERENKPGTRPGGSQFILDDKPGEEKIRIRTRSGVQLLLDETNGQVYVINKNGTSWLQMDADGNVDIFGAENFSVRSQKDINLRADRDVVIEGGRDVKIRASKDYIGNAAGAIGQPGSGQGGDILLDSGGNLAVFAQDSMKLTAATHDHVVSGEYRIDAGTVGIRSNNANLSLAGGLSVSGLVRAGGTMFAQDFRAGGIGLRQHRHSGVEPGGGQTGTGKGGGGSGNAQGPAASRAQPISTIQKTNVLRTFADENNFDRNTEQVLTVVGRFLTLEPCPEHTVKGSD